MTHAPADGITVLLAAIAVALMFVWAWRDRVYDRRADVEARHRQQRKAFWTVDRIESERFIEDVWVDVELAEMLDGEVAA